MNIGKILVGGLSGGAVGIAALIGLEAFADYHVGWMAPVIGALTGIGIRFADPSTGNYVRGAIAGILALACIVGGHFASSELIQRRYADAGKAGTPMSFPHTQEIMHDASHQAETDLGANAPSTPAATDLPATEPNEEVAVYDLPKAEPSDVAESSDSPTETDSNAETTEAQAELTKPQRDLSSPAPIAAAASTSGIEQAKVKPKSILSSSDLLWFTVGTAIAYLLGGSGRKSHAIDAHQ